MDAFGDYFKKTFLGWTEPKTLEERIELKMESSINKTADKMIEMMLSNKNIQKQIQLQVFRQLKNKLTIGDANGKKAKSKR